MGSTLKERNLPHYNEWIEGLHLPGKQKLQKLFPFVKMSNKKDGGVPSLYTKLTRVLLFFNFFLILYFLTCKTYLKKKTKKRNSQQNYDHDTFLTPGTNL